MSRGGQHHITCAPEVAILVAKAQKIPMYVVLLDSTEYWLEHVGFLKVQW